MKDELERIQRITGFTAADQDTLRDIGSIAMTWTDELVAHFYDLLYSDPTTAALLGVDERPAREQTFRDWYASLFTEDLSSRFWQQQWIIGLVHILRRINNAYMLGMMSVAQQFVLKKCLAEWGLERGSEVFGAFKRVTDTVGTLIAEAYFMNYVQAMEEVAGFRMNLIGRMMDMEVRKRLDEARKAME